MSATFFQNSKRLENNFGLRVAIMKLSLEGYLCMDVRDHGELPSIKLDRPYEALDENEPLITNAAEKRYASIERWGCRLWWRIENE